MFSVKASGLQAAQPGIPHCKRGNALPPERPTSAFTPSTIEGFASAGWQPGTAPLPQENAHTHTQCHTDARSGALASLHTLCDVLRDSIRDADRKHLRGVKDVGVQQRAVAFLLLGASGVLGPWGQTLPSPSARVFFWDTGVSAGHRISAGRRTDSQRARATSAGCTTLQKLIIFSKSCFLICTWATGLF